MTDESDEKLDAQVAFMTKAMKFAERIDENSNVVLMQASAEGRTQIVSNVEDARVYLAFAIIMLKSCIDLKRAGEPEG